MKNYIKPYRNEEGFVLVTAMLIMVVLTILGIAALSNTSIELQIAGNDRRHKEAFAEAEAGAVLGTELVAQNINCADGFTATTGSTIADIEGAIRVYERNTNGLAFYMNPVTPDADIGDITKADAAYPIANLAANVQKTHLYIGGASQMGAGGSLIDNSGYERKGKSGAGGGIFKMYDIYSQYIGLNNTESIVLLGWRHPVDLIDDCRY